MLKGDVSKTVTRSKQKCIILLFLLATHSLNYKLDPNVKPHPCFFFSLESSLQVFSFY